MDRTPEVMPVLVACAVTLLVWSAVVYWTR